MNALNKVKIENTFRINAGSALEAATLAAPAHYDSSVTTPVAGSDDTFIVVSTITSSTYYDVVFIESVSPGRFRVEVGSIRISKLECAQIIGGDDAVNEIGFYIDDRDEVVSAEEYNSELAYWSKKDKEKDGTTKMERYIKNKYTKVIMINGKFEEVNNVTKR